MSDSDELISQLEAFVLEPSEDDTSDLKPPIWYVSSFYSNLLPALFELELMIQLQADASTLKTRHAACAFPI